jgi:beta-lactamase class A
LKKINGIKLIIFAGATLLLAACGQDGGAAQKSSQKGEQVTVSSSRVQSQSSSSAVAASSASSQQAVRQPERVLSSGRALDKTSNAALVNVIKQSMSGLVPAKNGSPARWTVAVDSLDGSVHASVANWTPAESQFSASTIKLFILIRYYQCLRRGTIHATDSYTLAKRDVVEGSGILLHQRLGTRYTLQQLVTLMIEKSDNIATNVLIERLGGFAAVNKTISEVVGAHHHSELQRKMMDTSNIMNGKANRINASEATSTLLNIYRGKIIDAAASQEMLQPMLKTLNRTKLPAKLPSGAICYNKSGESSYRGIENDMALIKYHGHVFAIAALVELDGNQQEPEDALPAQTNSQVTAISNLGAAVTNWFGAK